MRIWFCVNVENLRANTDFDDDDGMNRGGQDSSPSTRERKRIE